MEPVVEVGCPGDRPRVGVAVAALVGVVLAGLGLGVAELTAGLRRTWRSPVYDVGDRVIDRVPRWTKDLAIDWFGTNDKKALLIGIALLLVGYAAIVGIIAFRWRLVAGVAGIALFGLLGSWAALAARNDPATHVVVPSLVGAIVTATTLVTVVRASVAGHADPSDDERTPVGSPTAATTDRRRFLALTSAAAAVAVVSYGVGRRLGARFDAAASRARVVLPRARKALPPVDPAATAPVDGVSPFFTPNADFYRIDINLTVPDIAAETWRLRVRGAVDRELELTYDQLLERELVEQDVTLTCVSNEVGGRLLGTARWLGVRLDDLLGEAGIRPAADQIVGRSIDGYTCGFPVAALDGRDALVAIGMNGEPLPLAHGFPARLIVPGLYGYVSATKWLAEIELTRFDQFEQYWVKRGWVDDAPVKASSRIDTPRGLSSVQAGRVAIAGVAWAQPIGVSAVQLQIDDGDWIDTELADEVNGSTWRQWSYVWDAPRGRHEVAVRAVDTNGAIQVEERSEPFPSGSTGWHQIVVLVS